MNNAQMPLKNLVTYTMLTLPEIHNNHATDWNLTWLPLDAKEEMTHQVKFYFCGIDTKSTA